MPEYVWNIGFAISLVFALSSSILIGRRISKTGVEHFSSRILIVSSIIDASLCGLLFLLQGVTELYRVITSVSFSFDQFILPAVFFVIPARIIWNYFAIQRKLVTKFHLEPDGIDAFAAGVAPLCKTMGICPPTISSSVFVTSPFVFGRRSNKAILAIPENWQCTNDSYQHIQLLHELAHIRNHDIGFLAWSNACLRDLRLLFIVLPALIVYCYFFGYSYTIPSVSLYLACSFILFVMLRYVVRKRETLADMTAALLIKSGDISDVISQQQIHTIKPHINSGQPSKPKLTDRIQRWLTDNALFSTEQWLWKTLLWIFNFFHASHPSNSERIRAINTQNNITPQPASPLGDSFWAGTALGLMGVVVGIGSYWFAVFIQKPPEETGFVRLPFEVYGMISTIPVGFLAIFLSLPVLSSQRLPTLNRQFFLSLLTRYAVALAGACLTCPLILIAGAFNHDVLLLLVTCVLWYVFITAFGLGVNSIVISSWVTIRYQQSSHIAELRKGIWAFGLFIIAIFGLISLGGILINNDMTFYGINVVFSTVAGGAFVSLTIGGSRFSETEEYIILCAPFLVYRLEGKWFKTLVWAIHSFYITALLLVFASLIYLATHFIFGKILYNLDSTLGIFIAGGTCCTVMVILERHGMGRVSERKRSKIHNLHHCLKLLSIPIDSQACKKINKVAASYDLGTEGTRNRILNLTIQDAYEIVSLVLDDTSQARILDHISKWTLRCQEQGGFGLWPTSAPRLYSTYQAISILRDVNLLDKCDPDTHILWIKTLQQPDGSFKGPWSERDAWEDTFFAAESLNMLRSSLTPEKTNLCRTWCRDILVNKGIEKNRPDIIYYCFDALTALGTVDDCLLQLVSDWFSSAVEELLLTNISLNYENVHFSLMVYDLLTTTDTIPSPQLNLLSDRIYTALKSELADIRI